MNQFVIAASLVNEIVAYARAEFPRECCGLIGGVDETALTIYPMRNVAANPLTMYEAAAEDLFKAQRLMRERGETLTAIYHSHPQRQQAVPSATDVRLAFYPQAVYVIVALWSEAVDVRAFRLSEQKGSWREVALVVK